MIVDIHTDNTRRAVLLNYSRTARFCFTTVLILLFQANAFTQDTPKDPQAVFHFILWHEHGGMVDSATSPKTVADELKGGWFDALMPVLTSYDLRVHIPQEYSLERYLHLIEAVNPQCIEADSLFLEQVVNRLDSPKYVPVLQVKQTASTTGEIIFFGKSQQWRGTLGVVHPWFKAGGRTQIEFWNNQANAAPEWVEYLSSREVLFHLFTGDISAAAVPKGALDRFLTEHDRKDLTAHITPISVPDRESTIAVYLRRDWYDNLLLRTLVTETWLRNRVTQRFESFTGTNVFSKKDQPS